MRMRHNAEESERIGKAPREWDKIQEISEGIERKNTRECERIRENTKKPRESDRIPDNS